MKCPICARETDSDAVFCEICGKKIPRCPSCGKVLYERSRFCDHDGAPLPEELFLDLPPDPSDAPPPQKKRSGAPLIAVLILLAVLLLAAGAGGYVLLGGELPFQGGVAGKRVQLHVRSSRNVRCPPQKSWRRPLSPPQAWWGNSRGSSR